MMKLLSAVAAIAACLLAIGAATAAPIDFSARKQGDPLEHLPAGARLISSFGERPEFSPDGKKIAFIGKSYGDAYEYNLATGAVRNLTAHAPNSGFLRIHYLPDGSYLLLGPRRIDQDRMAMRIGKIELWYMDKEAKGGVRPLDQIVSEGIAVSRRSDRIAWAVLQPRHSEPGEQVDEHTILKVGDVVVKDGVPALENVREIARRSSDQCVLEAQDFRDQDREVVANCYDLGGLKLSLGKYGHIRHNTVIGVPVAGGPEKTYYDVRDGSFSEVEGIAPSEGWSLVDCGPGYGHGLDICRLELTPGGGRLSRVTRFMDYGDHRVSNGVVSPDGKWIAFQFGRGGDEAGVGMGILLMPITASGTAITQGD